MNPDSSFVSLAYASIRRLLLTGLGLAALILPHSPAAADAPATLSYTQAQVEQGKKAYADHCLACHGPQLEGGAGPALAGPDFYNADMNMPVKGMFEYMVREMPVGRPGSLSHEDYAAVMAYILARNGYPAGSTPLDYQTALHSEQVLYFHAP